MIQVSKKYSSIILLKNDYKEGEVKKRKYVYSNFFKTTLSEIKTLVLKILPVLCVESIILRKKNLIEM